MSELATAKLDYREPRAVWILGLELFYTLIAMIPIYFYIIEILQVRANAENLVMFLPIGIALLLFFLELRLNSYFWFTEKVYKRRDLFTSSLKSVILIISSFYIIFLYVFGYWLSDSSTYQGIGYQNELSQLMAEVIISLLTIYFGVIMMLNIQNQRFERIFKERFQRKG
ncbi:MAG: hypothetical protein ACXAC2_20695 [Candidatus Kariarchaeaceae archaeon]